MSAARKATQDKKNQQSLAVEHLQQDLGKRAAHGSGIAIMAQVVRMGLQLANVAIMGRLLAPEDFGLVAIAMTVTAFVGLFTDLGLSAATVQKQDLDQETVSALFYVNILVGILLFFTTCAIAPLAQWFFGDGRIGWLVVTLAAMMPLSAAAVQHNALLSRGMRWMSIQWVAILSQTAGIIVGVVVAWKTDLGYWALVVAAWMNTIMALVLVWLVCPWRPGRVSNWRKARSAISFGFYLSVFNLFNYLHRQLDNVLIGWRWGAVELGYYSRAYTLLLLPLGLINNPVSSAIIPVLSRMQNEPERWRRAYLDALIAVTIISSGLAAILVVVAKPLVLLLLGSGWEKAGDVLQVLAVSMFAATVCNATGWIYISLAQTKRMMIWSLMSAPVFILAFALGVRNGAYGVALYYSASMLILYVPCVIYAIRKTPLSAGDIFVSTLPLMLSGGGSVVISNYVLALGIDQGIGLLGKVVIGGMITGIVFMILAMGVLATLKEYRYFVNRLLIYVSMRDGVRRS